MLRLLIDENFDQRILRGLRLRVPQLDYVIVQGMDEIIRFNTCRCESSRDQAGHATRTEIGGSGMAEEPQRLSCRAVSSTYAAVFSRSTMT